MRKSRLYWAVKRRLIEHFVSGSTARTAASLVGVNKNTAALYFHRLREIIAQESEDASPLFGEIEVDESYFGGHRKGKRGRGAAGKVPVFGLLKRGGKVYAKVIPNVKGPTLKAIIDVKVVPDSIVYSDTLSSYNVFDISSFRHFRINHAQLFSDRKNHINGIENF
jgi:transposase